MRYPSGAMSRCSTGLPVFERIPCAGTGVVRCRCGAVAVHRMLGHPSCHRAGQFQLKAGGRP